ncbi:MAG: formate dehydrogenase accessory sulfurtransferase FdhD [Actinomycetota bacterium]
MSAPPADRAARRPGPTTPAVVRVISGSRDVTRHDKVATEEPLEIRLSAGPDSRTVAVTMRTPGSDFELAAGFLHTEGVIASRRDLDRIAYCTDGSDQLFNTVTVRLSSPRLPDLAPLERYGTISSACGVCGKASLDGLRARGARPLAPGEGPVVDASVLYSLPDALRAAQRTFDTTGGLHAAGLFSPGGELWCAREDIGRHNTVDKVIGWALMNGRLADLRDAVLVVSGRAGFEIVQKAAAASVPVVCAVSAPSSLAVEAAHELGLTLVAFLRDRRANVYAGAHRVST